MSYVYVIFQHGNSDRHLYRCDSEEINDEMLINGYFQYYLDQLYERIPGNTGIILEIGNLDGDIYKELDFKNNPSFSPEEYYDNSLTLITDNGNKTKLNFKGLKERNKFILDEINKYNSPKINISKESLFSLMDGNMTQYERVDTVVKGKNIEFYKMFGGIKLLNEKEYRDLMVKESFK
ncbi:hypothetical protein [Staphylococcus phage vB_StaM_SA1]|nr:hypothetical protein [Staphylococcus phage vB_StaM_SA1]